MSSTLKPCEEEFLSNVGNSHEIAKSYVKILNTYENIITTHKEMNCTDFTSVMLKACQRHQLTGLELAAVFVAPQRGGDSFGHETVAVGANWTKPSIVFDPILSTAIGGVGYGQLNTMRKFRPRYSAKEWRENNAEHFIRLHGLIDLDGSRPYVALLSSLDYLRVTKEPKKYTRWS